MKIRIVTLCTALATALHAAPPASFVWHGKTVVLAETERLNDGQIRLRDGSIVPVSAVPVILRHAIPARPAGREISNRVLQVLPDGLLLAVTVTHIEPYGTVWEKTYDPVFLRGHPEQEKLVDGSLVHCLAADDGRYTYTAVNGAARTVAALRWVGEYRPPEKPSAFGTGSRITGSALDRK
jgi:hypothetical protein